MLLWYWYPPIRSIGSRNQLQYTWNPHMSDEHSPALKDESLGLSNQQLLDGLRGMIRARTVDDRLWLLSRQGKAHFVITSAGHEATQFGCAWAVNVGRD